MAIITEKAIINGVEFMHTYSDIGMKIERGGVRYDEAYDPMNTGRVYTETDEPIETAETLTDDEQYAQAGRILMGVSE